MADAAPHPNAALIGAFYAALGRRDAAAMIACYAPEATFCDPAFPALDAAGVAAMWRMLCARGKDLRVVASGIEAGAASGHAQWVANYTYSATGRPVENRIEATFEFRDGRFIRHVDRFDLARWARQALGWKGAVLAATPLLPRVVHGQAARALATWRARETA